MMMLTSTVRRLGLAVLMFLLFCCAKAGAQSAYDMSDAQGSQNNSDYLKTGEGAQAMPVNLGTHAVVAPQYGVPNIPANLASGFTGTLSTLAPKFGQTGTNGLPVCNMDSFVFQAAMTGQAEFIYGDEGSDSLPPLNNFEYINNGIGADSSGLTTGHGSMMPSAWGADEFIGNEWSMSGQ